VNIDRHTSSIEVSPYIEYIQEADLSFDDVLAIESRHWIKSESNVFKVPKRNEPIWVRLNLLYDNATPSSYDDWVFSIYNPKVEIKEAYVRLGNGQFSKIDNYNLTETDTPLFYLDLPSGLLTTLYIKINIYGSYAVSLKVTKQTEYLNYTITKHVLEGLFFGASFIMFLFSGIIYSRTNQKGYLYYSLYVLSFAYIQLVNDSMIMKIVSGYSTTSEVLNFLSLNSYYYLPIFHSFFINELFSMKIKERKLNRVVNCFIGFVIFMMVSDLFVFKYMEFDERLINIRITLLLYIIVTFYVLGKLVYSKVPNSRSVICSLIIPMSASVLIAFNVNSRLKEPLDLHVMTDVIRFSMVISFILLAFILANEFKRMWGMKRIAEEQMHEAEVASSSKSQFLANMSHEIRTPLTAIIGYSETIRDSRALSETKRKSHLDTVISSSHHLLNVINDILDVSKIESNKMTLERIAVPVPDLILGIHTLYESLVTKAGIDFNLKCDFPIPANVIGDQTRLNQVVMNLLGNALKFTTKGSITLKIAYSWQESLLIISVVDTGVGMTTEQSGLIFESFTQADVSTTRKHGGTGLGLTIVKELCELMEGTIDVESQLGEGSIFTMRVKASALDSSDKINSLEDMYRLSDTDERHESEVISFSSKVLVAEDNKDIQNLIVSIMKDFGCEVVACDNGSDAFIEFHNGQFDMILTDINMPIISGTTFVKILRSNGETLPIIAITANAMEDEVQEYIDAGCSDVIAKPVHREALAKKMMEYLPYNIVPTSNELRYFEGRVLVAEDNAANQEYIQGVLQEYGLQVTSVSDGESALEKCLSNAFDLVLLDLNMPNASGYEVVSTLISMSYAIPCYALTADNSVESKAKCIESGFVGLLSKPIEKKDIEKVFREHLKSIKNKKSIRQAKKSLKICNEGSSSENLKIKFTDSLVEILAELEKARSDNDWSIIQSIAHQIKGAGGSFGYNSLTELSKNLSKELEFKLNHDNILELDRLYDALIYRLKEIISSYNVWQSNLY
jgi:signal transduction histidine kinase/DNA-binding response OmpR family regulator